MNRRQASSGVSLAIHQTMVSYQKGKPLIEKSLQPEFTIKVANTLEEREAVFNLGYQVYLDKGYIGENTNEWLVQNYDSHSETVILIVQDQDKKIAGSVTLVFDGATKIPAEKIYANELKVLRKSGERLVELSRLVISPDYRNSKEILILLFNYLAVYIRHVKNYSGLTVQVNPRHKQYYKTLLSFDEIGSEKPCPQVQDAPAVLLFLSTKKYQSEIKRCRGLQDTDKKERSLYPFFIKPEQESLVAYYLEKQTKPMTTDEKQYFGFTQSGIGQAVAV